MKFYLPILPVLLTLPSVKPSGLSSIAAEIANNEFEHNQITSVVWWESSTYHVTDFIKEYVGIVVIMELNFLSSNSTVTKFSNSQLVFFAREPEDFLNFLPFINFVRPIRLILVLSMQTSTVSSLTEMTKAAWKNEIGNIVIVSLKDDNDSFSLTTYFPYNQGSCGDYTPVTLDNKSKTFFPNKYQNFYGCDIQISLAHYVPAIILQMENGNITALKGTDGKLIMLLMERLNSSLNLTVFGDSSYIFEKFMRAKTDITMPAMVLKPERYAVAQVTHVNQILSVLWCMSNPREIYVWAKILFPLFSDIALGLGLSCVGFLIAATLVQRYGSYRTMGKNHVLFQAIGLFLGQEIKFITKSWLLNSLFILWIWYCMVVRIAYQGKLLDGLHIKFLEPHFETFDAAVKAVDGYGGSPTVKQYYKNTSVEKKFQVIPLPQHEIWVNEIINGKRFLLAVDSRLSAQYRKHLQIIDEPVSHSPAGFHMRPRWPAAEYVDRVFYRMLESGFFYKSLQDYSNEFMRIKNVTSDNNIRALDFDTLCICFYGLIIQCFICFVVLCIEIIIFKVKQNKRLKQKKCHKVFSKLCELQ